MYLAVTPTILTKPFFFFKPFKISCHNCHRPCEIFSGKAKKSLSQLPQDFFQTSQNLLSHLPQAQFFFLWHLWQEMLRSLKFFCAISDNDFSIYFQAKLKSRCHKCHKIFFQTSQNLLSHLPQAQLFFLWQLWQEVFRSLKKNLVAFVTMTFQLWLEYLRSLVTIVTRGF